MESSAFNPVADGRFERSRYTCNASRIEATNPVYLKRSEVGVDIEVRDGANVN